MAASRRIALFARRGVSRAHSPWLRIPCSPIMTDAIVVIVIVVASTFGSLVILLASAAVASRDNRLRRENKSWVMSRLAGKGTQVS